MKARREASSWVKFRLLMWKCVLHQWRHPMQTAAELLLPAITMSLILLLRWQIEPRSVDVRIYDPIPAYTFSNHSFPVLLGMNFTEMSIAYSPKSDILEEVIRNAVLNLLIRNAIDLINIILENYPLPPGIEIPPDINSAEVLEFLKSLVRVDAYSSSSDLRGIYVKEETTRKVIAAVEFSDQLYGATELPINITYSLRFPERPRMNSFYLTGSRTWRTEDVFPAFELPGPRQPRSPVGGTDPGYAHEMFIQLQHAISTELITKMTGRSLRDFNIYFQRYPHPAYLQDFAIEVLKAIFPIFMMLTFSYTAINISRAVTVEKELQLKETLKIMGLPTWIHWMAWFWKQFIFLILTSVFIIVILKVNWFTSEEGYSDYAVFTNTPWTILLFFLALYLACTIFFCFMISGFFSKGSTAALFTGVIWFLTYIPAAFLTMDIQLSVATQAITCLSINTAMSYGFQLLLARESTGGMQWDQFFASPAVDNSRLLFGHVVLLLVMDCVLYMLIALYMEQVLPGPFGTPKRWYFLFQKNFWFYSKESQGVVTQELDSVPEITMEKDPVNHAVGVKMKNLTKKYGYNVAVNKLSLNIYDDQITVLLGHNGAGKSTTISMLTGNLPVTSGSIWLAGYDMSTQTKEARNHLGLCPQHNVLFNELTVKEHLEFFSRLKGYTGQELYDEIDSLITKLELEEKRDYKAEGLSGGQKRRLCVGIALCGSARVVLLDEPTSGMDPSARRALWDLLQKEKIGRSMILTTHFMDEADILGDRIAIMAHGQLQCVGSPYFLKQHYGVGYTLIVVKGQGFSLEGCTSLLSKHIPNIEIKEDRGTEVAYSLVNDHSDKFENMLNDLENNIHRIRFKNYGLEPTTLEDVFMSVGSDTVPIGSESEETDAAVELSEDGILRDFDTSSIDKLDNSTRIVTGIRLLWQHVVAIWIKLWLVKIRSWGVLLLQLLVPILQINVTLGVLQYIMSLEFTIPSRALTFAQGYASTESLLSFNGSNLSSLGALAKAAYEQLIQGFNIATMKVTDVENLLIDQYYLERADNAIELGSMRHSVLAGATFEDNSVTAWFSNFAYHDLPSSMAAVHNALLKAINTTAEINVYHHPLEANYNERGDLQMIVSLYSLQLSMAIGNSLAVVSAAYVMFYINERSSRAKLLQKAAGIQPAVMWGTAAVFDWLWLMVISITIVLSCLAFNVVGLSTFEELGRMYLCIMVYGFATLPLHYLMSYFFSGPASGFVVMYFINILFGLICAQIVEALSTPQLDTAEVAEILDNIFQFFPLYSFVTAIRSLNQVGLMEYTCLQGCDYVSAVLNIDECNMEVLCANGINTCCVRDNPYFDWEAPGILRYLVMMLITSVVLWILFLIAEYRILQKIFTRKQQPPPLDDSQLDWDVAEEARHVQLVSNSSHNLVARSLSKYYGNHLAVDQVSFTVSDSECFGLLGVNGAGKTTTFKMLMGDETISNGEAFISGYSVKRNITQVHKNIGYCPQFDAVFPELTGRETLRVFGLLRGMDAHDVRARTEALAHALGFTKHLDKRVYEYSGGNKRKLSTAVALMGRTRMVFVDEPTTGVDPAAKRQVWRAIRGAKRSGRGVVLTSHSMEECEALCSRLTIMVSGRFQCIGTPQHLKNKFSQGYTLSIKLKMDGEGTGSPATCRVAMDGLKRFVKSNFCSPKLMEEYQGLLTYYLPDRSVSWSRMFGIMESAKRDLDIEDYSISQTSLEQIFLQFTKYQNHQPTEIEIARL